MNRLLLHRRGRRNPEAVAAPRPARAACRLALLLVAVALFVAVGLPTAAAEFPPANDGWVTDLARLLSPTEERALEDLMESYEQGSDNEIALLTIPDLDGRSLESYALETARAWGIGKEGRHNAALILVAQAERKVRIEVGRGLEGTLTDSISGRIIRDVIAPAFKEGRFYEGLRAGIEATHAAAGGDYARIPRQSGRAKRSAEALVVPAIIIAILLFNGIGRAARGKRPRRDEGLLRWLILGALMSGRGSRSSGWHGGSRGGGFGGFGGGGGFSGGGASGGW